MTTEDGPGVPSGDGPRGRAGVGSDVPTGDGPASPRGVSVTKLPARGTVLVRSPAPPEVPTERCVDVRPGPVATFDGDRLEMSLSVRSGSEHRRFGRHELAPVECAVGSLLVDAGLSAPGDRDPEVVRFGDRAACRNLLPRPVAAAIERRLFAVASRRSGTLLTWTAAEPEDADYRTYDVVLDGPPA